GRVSLGTAIIEIDDAGLPPRNVDEDHRRSELRRRLELLLDRTPAPNRRPDGRLRILVILQNLNRGGSQLLVLERLRELIAAGTAEAVAVSPSDGALRQELESIGVPCHVSGTLIQANAILYEGKIAELAMWCAEVRRGAGKHHRGEPWH
ncbi:MAG TPA: hypothetical protein VE078_12025, partial [Thermoanaerobaculia bacterium]|nr:hypothetical protein [Thermoanaerobaculia bacterium]